MADIVNQFIQNQTDKILNKIDKTVNNQFYTASKTSLDEFRAAITSNGGLQRRNRYVFNITLPEYLRKTLIEDFSLSNAMYALGTNVFDGTLGLLCQSITIPAKQLNTTSIKINGQTRIVPMNYRWDNVSAEFIDTNNCLIYNTFYNWIDGINNPVTNTGKFYDDFVRDLRLDYLNRENEVVGYISLSEAYPISVSRSTMSYSDGSYVVTSVNFGYLYQLNRDYSSNMLYNILNNVTDGEAGKLLNTAVSFINTYNPIEMINTSLNSESNMARRKKNSLSISEIF